jgi:hypothetical protein
MSTFELEQELLPALRAGDLNRCLNTVSVKLATQPPSPYHVALELSIADPPDDVAQYFDDFFRQIPPGKAKAAYTEMNGFAINPGMWWFSPFAYVEYGGHDDYDWLSDWQFDDDNRCYQITGLESLQEVYANDSHADEQFSSSRELTDLLVVVKFQDLIRRSAALMKELRFPLLATAHDYDFIYEIRPKASDGGRNRDV